MTRPASARLWALPAAVALLTAGCVFLLPFAFPPSLPAYGQSYVVGFNNRVATVLIALISLSVGLTTLLRGVPRPTSEGESAAPVPLRYCGWMAAAITVWLGLIVFVLLRSNGAHAIDDGYFLPSMEKVLLSHRRLYTEVEFVYGPLLFYPTLWLARLFHGTPHSITVSYYVTVIVHHLIGLGMLLVVVNRLPLSTIMRRATFFSIAVFGLNPWLGLNYTLVRFLAPYFLLVLLDGIENPLLGAGWSFAATAIALYISPEIGIATTVGVVAYGIWRGIRQSKLFFIQAPAAAAGIWAAVQLAPADMLLGVKHYSGGFHHVVLLPSIYLCVMLAAVVWLAPQLLAGVLPTEDRNSYLLVGMYSVAMTMLPAMFGAAESMHVLSSGMGFLLLAAVYASNKPRLAKVWMVAVALTFAFFLAQTITMARYPLVAALLCSDPDGRLARESGRISPRLERKLERLESLNRTAPVVLSDWLGYIHSEPFTVLYPSYNYNVDSLLVSPQYKPLYFLNNADMYTEQDDVRMIHQLREVRWAFLGRNLGPFPIGPETENALELPTHFRQRHDVARNPLIAEEVKSHWVKVADVLPTLGLYRRAE